MGRKKAGNPESGEEHVRYELGPDGKLKAIGWQGRITRDGRARRMVTYMKHKMKELGRGELTPDEFWDAIYEFASEEAEAIQRRTQWRLMARLKAVERDRAKKRRRPEPKGGDY